MQHFVNNCPEYPSANYVINGQTNVRVDLRSAPKKPKLERARVMEGQTFRLNVNVCASYNADFDGMSDCLLNPCNLVLNLSFLTRCRDCLCRLKRVSRSMPWFKTL
ncbi:hypothetical protein BDZ88DRAFT_417924 [Geranomyces variabilis]|nr:hypothetical protein BDZ88DRAFT_417924 [Geranomyces variabilis]